MPFVHAREIIHTWYINAGEHNFVVPYLSERSLILETPLELEMHNQYRLACCQGA